MNHDTTAHLALGSNLGDRLGNLQAAVRLLSNAPSTHITRVSSLYETSPVGGPPGQGPYFNAALTVSTALPPDVLLDHCHRIEHRLGRKRAAPNDPRTIDIDVLLYGNRIVSGPKPTLPHPRMHLRRFVLVPLAEIAPDVIHPVRRRNIRQLLAELPEDAAFPSEQIRLVLGPEWAACQPGDDAGHFAL